MHPSNRVIHYSRVSGLESSHLHALMTMMLLLTTEMTVKPLLTTMSQKPDKPLDPPNNHPSFLVVVKKHPKNPFLTMSNISNMSNMRFFVDFCLGLLWVALALVIGQYGLPHLFLPLSLSVNMPHIFLGFCKTSRFFGILLGFLSDMGCTGIGQWSVWSSSSFLPLSLCQSTRYTERFMI